jgi:hypothetical protein
MPGTIDRRQAALAMLTLPLAAAAQGAPRSFAVISEFGREIRVTAFAPTTGSRLDTNQEHRLETVDGAPDKLALMQARKVIAATEAGAKVWLLAPLDTDLLDARGDFAEGSIVTLPADLADAMKQHGSTHLIAFTRYRGDAAIRVDNDTLGTGKFEGPGFYVDPHTLIEDTRTLHTTRGFLALYLYIHASLIDAGSGKVLRSHRIVATRLHSAQRPEDTGDPWNLLSTDEKLREISQMIIDEVGKAVPLLLAAR